MTVEEIKEQVSMRDVLTKYGIEVNRSGMCSCPFHGRDRHPSMKVFKDGYNCFTCHANGDVFAFIQNIENCDFKTAFISLGGTYEHNDNKVANRLIRAKFDRNKTTKEQNKQTTKDFKSLLDETIRFCDYLIDSELLFSDSWCDAQNKKAWLQGVWDEKYLQGNEVNEIDVIRVCREIRRKYDSIRRPIH